MKMKLILLSETRGRDARAPIFSLSSRGTSEERAGERSPCATSRLLSPALSSIRWKRGRKPQSLASLQRWPGISRLLFVFALATLFPFAKSHAAAEPLTKKETRPNILFCIADDWSWPHAGAYGDKVVKTPAFDRLAREGALFTRAFCATPSCTPSRAALLTGQAPHRLEEGGNLWGFLPKKFPVYPDLLEQAGYAVGCTRKGWGPGNFQAGGRTRNPAGPQFRNFGEFLKGVPEGKPFCFWFGSQDPHRPYEQGSGLKAGLRIEDVIVPPYLPDTPEVRSDLLDYYLEVQRFDREVGELLMLLESSGQLDNTLVIVTSDNGMPFPRCKTNLHGSGSHMPLAIRWPAKLKGGRVIDDFVSHWDMAPTFLEAAGIKALPEMTGQSVVGLLEGKRQSNRDKVFLERERHANVRQGDLSYPVRAVRTKDFLYLRNLRPDRWPGGDPELYKAVGPFGDCDGSPTKDLLLNKRLDSIIAPFFKLSFDKRPAEELYDLSEDPHQLTNVAGLAEYAASKKELRAALDRWMKETSDPRASSEADPWDKYPYFGAEARTPVAPK
jgi:N-sulfoglucosamine sulfohydrolase